MEHPRNAPRSKVHEDCRILGLNGKDFGSCTMIDLSKGGAKLKFTSTVDLPDSFVLILSRNRLVRRRCKVVWRSPKPVGRVERTIGVQFFDSAS